MTKPTHEASLVWEASPDLLCVLDCNGVFEAVNPTWHRLLGLRRDEMIGRHYAQFLHDDDRIGSREAFRSAAQGVPALRFENRLRASDGVYRWLRWFAVLEDGRIVCTARDISQEKENIETIREQRVEADLREQFLAVLGHDLRNPLAAMTSGIAILSRRMGDDPRLGEVINHMRQNANRMGELVDNMMDFARVRLGDGIGLNLTPVGDLSQELNQIVDELRDVSRDRTFEVHHQASGTAMLDMPRIKQAVSNLLGNAVTHGYADTPIRVSSAIADGVFTLSICNAGAPISERAREHLFKPFLRDKVQRSQQGLGLGLYIASEIVAAHGGSVDLHSDEQETCFTIRIADPAAVMPTAKA